MKKVIQILILCFSIVYSGITSAGDFSSYIKKTSKWIFDEQQKMSDAEIKKKVNEYFRDEVLKGLFQSLADEFGSSVNNENAKKLIDACSKEPVPMDRLFFIYVRRADNRTRYGLAAVRA